MDENVEWEKFFFLLNWILLLPSFHSDEHTLLLKTEMDHREREWMDLKEEKFKNFLFCVMWIMAFTMGDLMTVENSFYHSVPLINLSLSRSRKE